MVALSFRTTAAEADEMYRRAIKKGQSAAGYMRDVLRRALAD